MVPVVPRGLVEAHGTPIGTVSKSLGLAVRGESKPKGKPKRDSKVRIESGTFVIVPQSDNLPEGWEEAVALNPAGKTGNYSYHK